MNPPSFNDDFCLHQIIEQFDIQALVAQSAIKGFIVSVFPWAAGLDVKRFHANFAEQFLHCFSPELPAIIAANMVGGTAHCHQISQNIKHVLTVQPPCNSDRQAFAGELINDGEHAELAPITGFVLYEIVTPDMVVVLRPQANARSVNPSSLPRKEVRDQEVEPVLVLDLCPMAAFAEQMNFGRPDEIEQPQAVAHGQNTVFTPVQDQRWAGDLRNFFFRR